MTYQELYTELLRSVCVVTFIKKDGNVRNMLATTNARIASIGGEFNPMALMGHEKRCNIDNGNIAVWDMIIDEPRSFNINRVLAAYTFGNIQTKEQLNYVVEQFKQYDEDYSKNNPMTLSMDTEFNNGGNV